MMLTLTGIEGAQPTTKNFLPIVKFWQTKRQIVPNCYGQTHP